MQISITKFAVNDCNVFPQNKRVSTLTLSHPFGVIAYEIAIILW